ncbi:biopolymer transport protein ExbD [Desulfomicrobium macestii]|uniref:Biopolymer transport protein ExbD n=1 Tax=Desulfomicrobium macestii TaxID=90731 RepID=A0ABR9H6C6_9BACT|nr:biopolymer transporter ExbD [Desulfomicrobium macestii]MBE1426230.1 biopolymer transport protein ExbD [Desulfomicrobium macestii]
MINARHNLRGRGKTAEVNMAPLIDLVFLLLIFFMVTTSFVKETGVDVQRPQASTATLKEAGNILVGVSSEGKIFLESKEIDVRSVRAHVERSLAENPEGAVVIVADKESNTGVVIQVMDQCRLAGAENVSIAASRTDGES